MTDYGYRVISVFKKGESKALSSFAFYIGTKKYADVAIEYTNDIAVVMHFASYAEAAAFSCSCRNGEQRLVYRDGKYGIENHKEMITILKDGQNDEFKIRIFGD